MTSHTPKAITTSDPTRVEIEWDDGHRTLYTPAQLRAICPCAACVDEVTGIRTHDPATVPSDLTQSGARLVGNYALALHFSDGHYTGIFTFKRLRREDPALA
jgi:ATP-binding protein involved in chromosome partitioning